MVEKQSPKVTKEELQHLLKTFTPAPKPIQLMFVQGQKKFRQEKWKDASEIWSKLLDMEEEVASLEPKQCQWMGDVHERLGVAYLRQGLIQKSLACFQQVIQHAQERQYREELVIDVLKNMSDAYRDIGEMDRAMETGDEAKRRLRALVGVETPPDSTTEIVKVMDHALIDAVEGNFSTIETLLQDSDRHQQIAQYIDPETDVTFLMAAAGQGNVALVEQLLQIDKKLLEVRDIRGHTALAWSCRFGHASCISILLAKGAQFTALDTTEIKTWPGVSLRALQEHLSRLKNQTNSTVPPPPAPANVAPQHPIRKGEVTQNTVATKNTTTLPAGFHAAPVSEAAKSGKLVGRALARWDDSDAVPLSPTLDDEMCKTEWDQFETNKRYEFLFDDEPF